MKKLNNKRYLAQLAVISALLCGCLAVAAQEVQASEPVTDKTTELSGTRKPRLKPQKPKNTLMR
jgi:hypothetical protein